MGMVKKAADSVDGGVGQIPPVPSLPKTTVNPQPTEGTSPVAPVQKRANENGSTGMTKQEWKERNDGISVDAIHKSMLESPTLANLCIGKNDQEVYELLKDFFRYNLALNRQAKSGDL